MSHDHGIHVLGANPGKGGKGGKPDKKPGGTPGGAPPNKPTKPGKGISYTNLVKRAAVIKKRVSKSEKKVNRAASKASAKVKATSTKVKGEVLGAYLTACAVHGSESINHILGAFKSPKAQELAKKLAGVKQAKEAAAKLAKNAAAIKAKAEKKKADYEKSVKAHADAKKKATDKLNAAKSAATKSEKTIRSSAEAANKILVKPIGKSVVVGILLGSDEDYESGTDAGTDAGTGTEGQDSGKTGEGEETKGAVDESGNVPPTPPPAPDYSDENQYPMSLKYNGNVPEDAIRYNPATMPPFGKDSVGSYTVFNTGPNKFLSAKWKMGSEGYGPGFIYTTHGYDPFDSERNKVTWHVHGGVGKPSGYGRDDWDRVYRDGRPEIKGGGDGNRGVNLAERMGSVPAQLVTGADVDSGGNPVPLEYGPLVGNPKQDFWKKLRYDYTKGGAYDPNNWFWLPGDAPLEITSQADALAKDAARKIWEAEQARIASEKAADEAEAKRRKTEADANDARRAQDEADAASKAKVAEMELEVEQKKIQAELDKQAVEDAKLETENRRLDAEQRKIDMERQRNAPQGGGYDDGGYGGGYDDGGYDSYASDGGGYDDGGVAPLPGESAEDAGGYGDDSSDEGGFGGFEE